ncbi:IS1634 family transposase [Micromonospora sp. M12]
MNGVPHRSRGLHPRTGDRNTDREPVDLTYTAGPSGRLARESAVEEVFGIDPALLNDDRLGRALDAIALELDHIIGTVGAQAITAFGLDTSRLHWDMTSISLYGAYDQTDDEYAAPKFGHPKDRRVDLNQIQAGLAVAGDGGIPVFHRDYDGGAGEVAQVVAAMTELTKMTAPRDFLLIGDSKLVSYGNVSAMIEAGVGFIAPRPLYPHAAKTRQSSSPSSSTIS